MMKKIIPVAILVLCLSSSANAELWISVNGKIVLPESEIWQDPGDTVMVEVMGDGMTDAPVEGLLYIEGRGSIAGHRFKYKGNACEYSDLEQVAQAMEVSEAEALAVFQKSTGRALSDLAKWVLSDTDVPAKPLDQTLIDEIVFRCEGEGDVLLTLETSDSSSMYEDYTIVIHQGPVRFYYVDVLRGDDNNSGIRPGAAFASIRKAIDSAENGDTVIVLPGVYTGDGNRDIDFNGKAITVRSSDPNDPDIVAATIVDCQGTEEDRHRGFYFRNSEGPDCVVAGLTIINGYAPIEQISVDPRLASVGGAIRCSGASPTIRNCVITGNTVGGGDGGYSADGGSGIYGCGGPISGCTIAGNSSDMSGGRKGAVYGCDGSITDCIIRNNRHCGGLNNCNGPISGCVIEGNSRTDSIGGGVAFCYGAIRRCVISGNSALFGGGICGSPVAHGGSVANCIITGNRAKYGGGFYNYKEDVTNCTIAGNLGWGGRGGAMYLSSGGGVCIRFGNRGFSGAAESWSSAYTYSDELCWSEDAEGNILGPDPLFAAAGYWDANGTAEDANDDFWVEGDYHLQSQAGRWDAKDKRWVYDARTSPCIDAGSPGSPLGDEPESPLNMRINMGAYGGTAEAGKTPAEWSLLADLTNDGIVNGRDFAHQAKDWRKAGDQRPGDLKRNGVVEVNDLAALLADWLKETSWH